MGGKTGNKQIHGQLRVDNGEEDGAGHGGQRDGGNRLQTRRAGQGLERCLGAEAAGRTPAFPGMRAVRGKESGQGQRLLLSC